MAVDVTRRRFTQGSIAVGGGLALAGPISALQAASAQGQTRRSPGYGDLQPTPEEDSGVVYLALPPGFRYRIISRQNDPMDDGNPTPGIFDGMAAYPGRGGTSILIRNHENRSRPGEIPVAVPFGKRYDPDPNTRGGNTKLVVSRSRQVIESYAVLGGTHTNCAGGLTPWDSWITCEEIFNYGSVEANVSPTGMPHGYSFEVDAHADGPVEPIPIRSAGRFAHEACTWLDGVLYETEDRGDAAFYRFLPRRRPREAGDLASFGGTLQALVVRGRPNFDANTANPGETYPVEWVTIEEPNPPEDTVRVEATAKDAAIFDRTEGAWTADNRIYFDCTTGGESQAGQLWEYRPRGRDGGELKLIYESPGTEELDGPDNVVVVPHTGDVWLQEDASGEQFIRGVTRRGEIYDFARTILNNTEFCGGTFSPDGRTFFVNQQGDRVDENGEVSTNPGPSLEALTFAIWGPFGGDDDDDDDDDRGRGSRNGRGRARDD
jgi:secreted PhoX family phosphatase